MIDLNTPMQTDACPSHIPSGAIPVLSTVMPEAAVSQAMRDAWVARAQKKSGLDVLGVGFAPSSAARNGAYDHRVGARWTA